MSSLFAWKRISTCRNVERAGATPWTGEKITTTPEHAPLGTSGGCASFSVKTLLTIRKLCTTSRNAHNVKKDRYYNGRAFLQNAVCRVPCPLLQVFLRAWIKYYGSYDSFIENKNCREKIKRASGVGVKIVYRARSKRFYEKKKLLWYLLTPSFQWRKLMKTGMVENF